MYTRYKMEKILADWENLNLSRTNRSLHTMKACAHIFYDTLQGKVFQYDAEYIIHRELKTIKNFELLDVMILKSN